MVARHNEGVARDERDCARCARCTVQVSAPAQALPSFQIAMRRCGVLPFLAPRFVVSSRSQESLPSQPCTSRRPLCASGCRPFIHAIPPRPTHQPPAAQKKKRGRESGIPRVNTVHHLCSPSHTELRPDSTDSNPTHHPRQQRQHTSSGGVGSTKTIRRRILVCVYTN